MMIREHQLDFSPIVGKQSVVSEGCLQRCLRLNDICSPRVKCVTL